MLIIFISLDFTNIYSVHAYWRFGSMITELFFFFLKTVIKIYCFNNDQKNHTKPQKVASYFQFSLQTYLFKRLHVEHD